MYYRFDLEKWLPRFRLEVVDGRVSGEEITGPGQLCRNELLRRQSEIQRAFDWGPAVPVDVFVMADGEPEDRSATKIGGAPYRPSVPWPTHSGRPMRFVAQVNFTLSKDLTGNLPGDILVIFDNGYFDPVHFEWYTYPLTELIPTTDIPRIQSILPCFGYVCRTVSFPQAKPRFDPDEELVCKGMVVESWDLITRYKATQIGKAPYCIQESTASLSGRPLCVVNSVCPEFDQPYPWVNREAPLKHNSPPPRDPVSFYEMEWISTDDARIADYDPIDDEVETEDYLTIADSGCFHVSIDEHSQLHEWDEYY